MSARQLVVNSTLKHTQSHYGYYKTSQTMFLPLVFIIIPRENFFNIRAALLNFLTAQQVFFYIGLECYYFKSVWTFWKFTTFAAFSVCFFPPVYSPTKHLLNREQALLTARRDPILTRERVYEPVRYPNVYDSYAEATKTPSFVGGAKVEQINLCGLLFYTFQKFIFFFLKKNLYVDFFH